MKLFLLFTATLIGCGYGLILSVLINSVLIEISINAFFNIYYGLLFLLMGAILMIRINQKNKIASHF